MNENIIHRIAIVDSVGRKAGMDLYDCNLAKALKSSGAEVFIFSNFNDTDVTTFQFFRIKPEGIMSKIINIVQGHFRSFIRAKSLRCSYVILHSFSFEQKDLFVHILAQILGLKVLLIVHDVSGFAKKDKKWRK